MSIQCFLIEPTDKVRMELRRYRPSGGIEQCPASGCGYHNAQVGIGDGPLIVDARGMHSTEPSEWPRDDPRWPKACACGYEFTDTDNWQLFWNVWYRRTDNGERCVLSHNPNDPFTAPPGAMWFAPWLSDCPGSIYHQQRGGGPPLLLRTPGGEWNIDSVANNGPGWERSGEAPLITAHPSILCNAYHGWLRNGVLEQC